jgi:hypothetical protein
MKKGILLLTSIISLNSYGINHSESAFSEYTGFQKTLPSNEKESTIDKYMSCLKGLETATKNLKVGKYELGESSIFFKDKKTGKSKAFVRTKTKSTFEIDVSKFEGTTGEYLTMVNGVEFYVVSSNDGSFELHDKATYKLLYKKDPAPTAKIPSKKVADFPSDLKRTVASHLKELINVTEAKAKEYKSNSKNAKSLDYTNMPPLHRCYGIGESIGDTNLMKLSKKALAQTAGHNPSIFSRKDNTGNAKMPASQSTGGSSGFQQ